MHTLLIKKQIFLLAKTHTNQFKLTKYINLVLIFVLHNIFQINISHFI